MNNFPRYDSYKDSGVDWLGDIPSHWEVIRSKRLFQQRTERARKDDGQLTASQKFGVIVQEEFMELEGRRVTQVEFNRSILKHIEPNDFLISMRSFQGGIEFSSYRGCVSSAYVVLKPIKNIVPEFYQYLLKSDGYIRALSSTSNLVRDGQALRFENFSLVDLVVIPEAEQTAIAEFLDRKTTQIEQAITQKEQLIELLKERRRILIHNAIIRGLNPNVKMKDSGVEWIGEIPEHWDILPGLRFFRESKEKNTGMKEKTVLSLSYGKIIIKPEERLVGLVPESFETYQIVKPDHIVIRCTDLQNDQTSLRTGLVKNVGIITSAYLALEVRAEENPAFYHYYLHALDTTKILYKFGSGLRQNLSFLDFKRLPTIRVPRSEQDEIVKYLNKVESKIETAISCKRKEIEKLKEYKAVLINSAVTGKIKVCGNSQNAEVKSSYAQSNE
jgi:type I restriction enzyme S subunit